MQVNRSFQMVEEAKCLGGFSVKVEVEARTEQEAVEAAQAGADIVMLDNFKPQVPKTFLFIN